MALKPLEACLYKGVYLIRAIVHMNILLVDSFKKVVVTKKKLSYLSVACYWDHVADAGKNVYCSTDFVPDFVSVNA